MQNTQEDFERHLAEQLELLETAADLYDSGQPIQAKAISGYLRTILHDRGRTVSVLSHLGIKDETRFCDTKNERPQSEVLADGSIIEVVGTYCGLACFPIVDGEAPVLQPNLGPLRRCIGFSEWWNDVVVADETGNELTRADLVLSLAEKDGGVHVDLKLHDEYAMFSRGNQLGHLFSATDAWEQGTNPEFPIVRQIAHEVLLTLKSGYKKELDINDCYVYYPVGIALKLTKSDSVEKSTRRDAGRNQPCPCGSGLKYKWCCGKNK